MRRGIIAGSAGVIVAGAIAAFFLLSSGEGYVASRTSDVFHLPSCTWTGRISDENKVFYQTYQEAIDDGKRPCRRCNPTEGSGGITGKVTIAVWNIRDFSSNSRDPQELQQICDIFRKYDLIAIVEQQDEDVLTRSVALLGQMGRSYAYDYCPDDVGNGEHYAFLYDTSLFEVVEPGRKWPDGSNEFRFDPYYATLRTGNFDFTMILTHIRWSGTVGERRAELGKLADVFTAVQDVNANEQDVILAGDFNQEPDDHGYDTLKALANMMHIFSPPAKSKIQDTKLYDNMWFQSAHVREYAGENGIDMFDETDFGNDDAAANRAVSDHRPVWAAFYTGRADDDGVVVP